MLLRRLVRAARRDDGYTLIELLSVLIILTTVLTSLTALFVSGAKAELELNRRFEAQQAARVAADRMRREVHCASGVTFTNAASITVTLPGHCPTAVGGATTNVVYATENVSTGRYRLKRGTVPIADSLTSGDVFSYVAPSNDSLGRLHLDFRVNVNPAEAWKSWHLETDVVLRNTLRDP
jgi:prepilin-type N-terminal cleavage/methylation domain-containing protein